MVEFVMVCFLPSYVSETCPAVQRRRGRNRAREIAEKSIPTVPYSSKKQWLAWREAHASFHEATVGADVADHIDPYSKNCWH